MLHFARKAAIVTGVMLAVSTAGQAQVIYGHENPNLKRATNALMAGELENASKHFRRAVKSNLGAERLIPALNNYCAVEYALENLENAERVCSQAIAEDRRYWRAYVNRGNVRTSLGKLEAARSDYEKAVKLKPNSRIAQDALARVQKPNPTLLADATQ